MAENKHGLDVSYFEKKVLLVHRDINLYTKKELARELVRLAYTADSDACVFECHRLDIKKGECL